MAVSVVTTLAGGLSSQAERPTTATRHTTKSLPIQILSIQHISDTSKTTNHNPSSIPGYSCFRPPLRNYIRKPHQRRSRPLPDRCLHLPLSHHFGESQNPGSHDSVCSQSSDIGPAQENQFILLRVARSESIQDLNLKPVAQGASLISIQGKIIHVRVRQCHLKPVSPSRKLLRRSIAASWPVQNLRTVGSE